MLALQGFLNQQQGKHFVEGRSPHRLHYWAHSNPWDGRLHYPSVEGSEEYWPEVEWTHLDLSPWVRLQNQKWVEQRPMRV